MVRHFFASPAVSIRCWEPALLPKRIVREMEAVLDRTGEDVLVVGHGAVGTLLFCHYSKVAISGPMIRPRRGELFRVSSETGTCRVCMGGGPWSWHPSLRLTARSSDLGR